MNSHPAAAAAPIGVRAARLYRRACLRLARCETDLDRVDRLHAKLMGRACRLRAEKQALRDALDRRAMGGRP